MSTGNKMIPLFSGDVKQINHLHIYKDDNPAEDLVLVVNQDDIITYYLLDRVNVKILKRKPLPYLSKVTQLLKSYYPYISSYNISLLKVFGLFDKKTNPVPVCTIYFIMYNYNYDENFIVQMNIKNHDTINAEFILVNKYRRSKNQYLDLLVKQNVLINDYQKIADVHSYIMFINVQDAAINGSYIEGLRMLVSYEEKQEFKEHNPTIEFPDSMFPVIDEWSVLNTKFIQLPHDTERVSFSFSTGLGYIKFKE